MNAMIGSQPIPAPRQSASDFFAYDAECRNALKPLVAGLLDMAEAAGWNRRAVASTLMFLAAQHVSAASETQEWLSGNTPDAAVS